jgi:hypothetical protein
MSPSVIVYLIFVSFAALAGSIRWSLLQWPDRFLLILLFFTLGEEILNTALSGSQIKNLNTFLVYSPLELFLFALYFNYSVPQLRAGHAGIWVGVAGIVAGVLIPLLTNVDDSFSYYLVFENTMIILMCLLSFYHILMREDHSPTPMAHFWIVMCILLYHSVNLTGWGLYSILDKTNRPLRDVIKAIREYSNMLFYAGLALVFLRYPKLIPSGA